MGVVLRQRPRYFHKKTEMKSFTKPLVSIAVLLTIAITSCSKLIDNPPIPLPNIHSLEEFPFQDYVDSLNALAADSQQILYSSGSLIDPWVMHQEVPGQAECAYVFRSSVPGVVTSLGVLEPSTGYTHTVTLWDSATSVVLAQANVPSLDSGHWTYVSLALNGLEVPIQANHAYIVGFNTLALQSTISTGEVSDFLYVINGVYDFRQTPTGDNNGYYILPFVSKSFTFEGEYLVEYDPNHPLTGPPFNGFSSNTNNLFGTVDIGFIPEPQ
jgi:hypothetical protein